MRIKLNILALAPILFIGATSAAAAQVSKDAEEAEAAPVPDDSQVIKCERLAVTGSRARKKRVCLTVAEWEARRSAGQRTADAVLQDASRGFPINN